MMSLRVDEDAYLVAVRLSNIANLFYKYKFGSMNFHQATRNFRIYLFSMEMMSHLVDWDMRDMIYRWWWINQCHYVWMQDLLAKVTNVFSFKFSLALSICLWIRLERRNFNAKYVLFANVRITIALNSCGSCRHNICILCIPHTNTNETYFDTHRKWIACENSTATAWSVSLVKSITFLVSWMLSIGNLTTLTYNECIALFRWYINFDIGIWLRTWVRCSETVIWCRVAELWNTNDDYIVRAQWKLHIHKSHRRIYAIHNYECSP